MSKIWPQRNPCKIRFFDEASKAIAVLWWYVRSYDHRSRMDNGKELHYSFGFFDCGGNKTMGRHVFLVLGRSASAEVTLCLISLITRRKINLTFTFSPWVARRVITCNGPSCLLAWVQEKIFKRGQRWCNSFSFFFLLIRLRKGQRPERLGRTATGDCTLS